MKRFTTLGLTLAITSLTMAALLMTTACSSSGSGYSRSSMHYGAGYRGYHGRPWGYPPHYVGGGVDPDWGVSGPDAPVAEQLPEMGMPDFGGFDDMDMGGFDW